MDSLGRYDKASTRTERAIQEAYWKLYTENESGKVSVGDVCDLAEIHRSTFYYHYRNTEDILESIKERQMELLMDLFSRTGGKQKDFESFIPGFQQLYDENEIYLKPLVMEYRDREFSFRYRSYLEERMFEDLQISYDGRDPRTEGIITTIVSGLVNMFLVSLATRTVSLEDSNALSHGMINVGLRSVLRDRFGIRLGFITMKGNIFGTY